MAFNTGSEGSFRPRISLEQELGEKRTPLSSEQAMCQPLGIPFGEAEKSAGDTHGEGRCSSIHTVPIAYREGWETLFSMAAYPGRDTQQHWGCSPLQQHKYSTDTFAAFAQQQSNLAILPPESSISQDCTHSVCSPRDLPHWPCTADSQHTLPQLAFHRKWGFPLGELRDSGAGGPFQVWLHPCCWLIPSLHLLHPPNTTGPCKGGKGSDQPFLLSSAVRYRAKHCAKYPQAPSNNPKSTVTS